MVASLIVCYVNSHEYCSSSGFRGTRKVRDHDCATFQGIRGEVEAARGVGQVNKLRVCNSHMVCELLATVELSDE